VPAGLNRSRESDLRARIDRAARAARADALVIIGPGSVRLAAGYWARSARLHPMRPAIVLWPWASEPILFVGADQLAAPRRESWIEDVRGYSERGPEPAPAIAATIAAAIEELGLAGARIGVELDAISALLHQELCARLPRAELLSCASALAAARAAPGADGLAIIRAGCRAVERGLMRALRSARAGWSERRLAAAIGRESRLLGVSDMLYVLLGAGEGARGFLPPTDRPMQPGELVRIDLLAVHEGYFVDVGRMAVVEAPDPGQEDSYQRQRELNQALLEFIRPGVKACEVFSFAERTAEQLAVELLDQPLIGIGHTIGVNPKDYPMLKPADETPLEPGQVINVEADTYGPDREVVHLEDMVLVTDAGAENLTALEDWSALPRIAPQKVTR
jgi:Xaa-Pro aminopeptidase/Xaa-Pro dipeptidase